MGRFLSPGYTANLSEDREISDSDDDSLPSVREILARLKQKEVIDLTADDDDGGRRGGCYRGKRAQRPAQYL